MWIVFAALEISFEELLQLISLTSQYVDVEFVREMSHECSVFDNFRLRFLVLSSSSEGAVHLPLSVLSLLQVVLTFRQIVFH